MNARLFINDYWRLAIKHQAYGVQWIERLLDAGVRTLQLRIKDQRDEEGRSRCGGRQLRWAAAINARLFINDYWRLAIKHQAYGV
ncbi:hypothetical protein CQA18_25145, partial [Enterobacter hormaechei]